MGTLIPTMLGWKKQGSERVDIDMINNLKKVLEKQITHLMDTLTVLPNIRGKMSFFLSSHSNVLIIFFLAFYKFIFDEKLLRPSVPPFRSTNGKIVWFHWFLTKKNSASAISARAASVYQNMSDGAIMCSVVLLLIHQDVMDTTNNKNILEQILIFTSPQCMKCGSKHFGYS